MNYKIYQVDAFANKPFEGNPAAVVPLESWLDDMTLQNIAMENNLSETAFFVKENNEYHIRWFTPKDEVDMCGHATLASAYVIFNELGYELDELVFNSKSGKLTVTKEEDVFCMDFPLQSILKVDNQEQISRALGVEVKEVYKSMDFITVLESETDLQDLTPNFALLSELDLRGIAITSKSDEYDFVCRFFAPKFGINEDPITGSAYTQLVTYWSEVLNKREFYTKQISSRGGIVRCELKNERCIIKGKAVKYLEGTIKV